MTLTELKAQGHEVIVSERITKDILLEWKDDEGKSQLDINVFGEYFGIYFDVFIFYRADGHFTGKQQQLRVLVQPFNALKSNVWPALDASRYALYTTDIDFSIEKPWLSAKLSATDVLAAYAKHEHEVKR
jgi:hypothetical protein